MIKEIRIYIEGGGDTGRTAQPLRHGFEAFFKEINHKANNRIKIILCGGRKSAFDDFKIAVRQHQDAFNILLVDAEGEVANNHTAWEHLKKRVGDEWDKPKGISDEQCHLMVQTMEAWLIADLEAVGKYYGQGFKKKSLPKSPKVEEIPKKDLEPKLVIATRNTTKGEYHKIRHASELLGLINVKTVRDAAPHCNRLFETLENKIKILSKP